MGLGGKSRQVFGFKGLIGKVFRNKGLGVLNSTDTVLVSPFIASAPVAMLTPPPLKAGAKTKGVAGGHALIFISVELSANFGFAVWRLSNLSFAPLYFCTDPRGCAVMAITLRL